jgi:hypothetical protein
LGRSAWNIFLLRANAGTTIGGPGSTKTDMEAVPQPSRRDSGSNKAGIRAD